MRHSINQYSFLRSKLCLSQLGIKNKISNRQGQVSQPRLNVYSPSKIQTANKIQYLSRRLRISVNPSPHYERLIKKGRAVKRAN